MSNTFKFDRSLLLLLLLLLLLSAALGPPGCLQCLT
jgi:hypothetical protein